MNITARQVRHAVARALVAALVLASAVGVTPASAAGGHFSEASGGTYTGHCHLTHCRFTLTGFGTGYYIGRSHDVVHLVGTGQNCSQGSGHSTFTSTSNAADSVSMDLSIGVCTTGQMHGTYTVTGGTGMFAHASGSGTITARMVGSGLSGDYKMSWLGTLSY